MSAGCDISQHGVSQHDTSRVREVINQSEALSVTYLRSDVSRARESLIENGKLLEAATNLEPIGRAQLLALSYSRLHVLEKRAKNEAAAQAALIKAQYWFLKKGELLGEGIDEAINEIDGFSNWEQVANYIDGFDARHNNGKQPEYLRSIQ
jgi:hypothetical protein